MIPRPDVAAVRHSGHRVELELRIPKTLEFFPAHFPRFPMLPGVVQVDWAIRYAREHLALSGDFRQLRGVKFLHPILPGLRVRLTLSQEDPGRFTFTYADDRRTCSTGLAVFGDGREP